MNGGRIVGRSVGVDDSDQRSLERRIVKRIILSITTNTDVWLGARNCTQIVDEIVRECVWSRFVAYRRETWSQLMNSDGIESSRKAYQRNLGTMKTQLSSSRSHQRARHWHLAEKE